MPHPLAQRLFQAGRETDGASGREADQHDQDHARDGDMRRRVVRERFAERDDEYGPDKGSEPQADAADDDHRQRVDRPLQAEHAVWLDRPELHRLDGAGHGRKRARQHKSRKLHPERANAHLRRRILVVPDRAQDHGGARPRAGGDDEGRDKRDDKRVAKQNRQSGRIVLQEIPVAPPKAETLTMIRRRSSARARVPTVK